MKTATTITVTHDDNTGQAFIQCSVDIQPVIARALAGHGSLGDALLLSAWDAMQNMLVTMQMADPNMTIEHGNNTPGQMH